MSTDGPLPGPATPHRGRVEPGTGSDPLAAAVRVPVARLPVGQLGNDPARPAPPAPPPALDTAALPDDTGVLKQMIAELLRELRRARRDQAEVQQRLDALLRRLY